MEDILENEEPTVGAEAAEKSDDPVPATKADNDWTIDAPNGLDIESDNSSRVNSGEQLIDTSTSIIDVTFVDFAVQPIEGLKYKFVAGEKNICGSTDTSGKAQQVADIAPGTEVEIHVFREHTKDFKLVGALQAHGGWVGYTVVSPKLKFEVETEPHVGEPGQAETNLPPVPPTIESTTPQSSDTAAQQAEKKAENSTASVKPPPAPSAAPVPKAPQTAKANNNSTQSGKPAVTTGRDSRGNPQATVQDSTVDWFKRKILAAFNFWSWTDFHKPQSSTTSLEVKPNKEAKATSEKLKGKKATEEPSHDVAKGHPKVNPLSAPAIGGKLTNEELIRLNKLIAFTENQVLLDYKPYKTGGSPTLSVLNEYKKSDSPSFGKKPSNVSIGLCQPYVKIALFKSGYTNGPGNESRAKTSGKDWLAYGFTDISSQLPQIEISYENVIAPKDLPKAIDVAKKRGALKRLKEQRRTQKKQMSDEEIASAEKDIPAMPDPTTVVYRQPDIMYTVPGDVIVYEQVDPIEEDMAGHVDIRTYHGFLSDFVWPLFPSLGGPPKKTKRFRVIGIYRKASDCLAYARVRAFLQIVREHEAKGFSDPYRALKFDSAANPPHITFSDYSTHPYAKDRRNKPAGAYQIKFETWEEVTKKLTGWPMEFNPDMQDRIALFLLHRRPYESMPHPRRSALGYIMEGKVEDAVNKTKLWNEWACLPGGGRQSQMDMDELKSLFDRYVQEYSR